MSGLGSHLLPEHLGQPARGVQSRGAPAGPTPTRTQVYTPGLGHLPCLSKRTHSPATRTAAGGGKEKQQALKGKKKVQTTQQSCLSETLQEAEGDLAPMQAFSLAGLSKA